MWKSLLETSGLVLALVNGCMLFWFYWRDRPILKIGPIHPDVYQWYIRLTDLEKDKKIIRRYAFIPYIGIQNSGLRDVSVTSWRLKIKDQNGKGTEMVAHSMIEPEIKIGEAIKIFNVFGVKGRLDGDTFVKAGASISGMSLYRVGFRGHDKHNPIIKEHKIQGKYIVGNVYGKKSETNIFFHEMSLAEAKKIVPSIDDDWFK